jgi:predicted O-methyltransferase YrrM
MAHGGRLDTFEYEPRHAEVARESFRRAGLEDHVRIHVGRALEQLPEIESDGPFDLLFIDADKAGYPDYLRWGAVNLRRGGVVLADNVFRAAFGATGDWSARVWPLSTSSTGSPSTAATSPPRSCRRWKAWRSG